MFLQQGSQGDSVRWLQAALNLLPYTTPKLTVDGRFGPATLAALNRWQQQHFGQTWPYVEEALIPMVELDGHTAQQQAMSAGVTGAPGGSYAGATVTGKQAPASVAPGAAAALKAALVSGPAGVAFLFGPAIATGLFTPVAGMPGYFRNEAGNLFKKVSDGARELLTPFDPGSLDWLKTLGIIATSLIAIGPLLGIGIFVIVLMSYLGGDE